MCSPRKAAKIAQNSYEPTHRVMNRCVEAFGFSRNRSYIYGMKVEIMEHNNLNGLNKRQVMQIIRRKMIQKSVPSKKVYSRKNRKQQKDLEN